MIVKWDNIHSAAYAVACEVPRAPTVYSTIATARAAGDSIVNVKAVFDDHLHTFGKGDKQATHLTVWSSFVPYYLFLQVQAIWSQFFVGKLKVKLLHAFTNAAIVACLARHSFGENCDAAYKLVPKNLVPLLAYSVSTILASKLSQLLNQLLTSLLC